MISVIIPVYNAEHFIEQQLERFEQQKLAGAWELIVSDNGSTDSTLEIVKSRQKNKCLISLSAITPNLVGLPNYSHMWSYFKSDSYFLMMT